MLLKKLKLRNIRSYVDGEIAFPENSALLSGDIGSGKTTILLAIEFALFGILRGSLSGEALLRKGKSTGEVDLEFEIENKNILIKRILKQSKDEVKQAAGYIIIDNKKEDLTPVELKTRIVNLMGYPEELVSKSKNLIFRYTVYTPQEEMKTILIESPELRLDNLRKIFGVDRYKRVRDNTVIITRYLKEKKKIMASKIEDLEFKKEKEKELLERLLKVEKQYEILADEIEGMKNLRIGIEAEYAALESSIKKYSELNSELKLLSSKIGQKNELIAKITADIDKAKERIEKDAKEIEAFRHDLGKNKLDDDLKGIKSKIDEHKKSKALLSEKYSSKSEHIRRLDQEISELSVDISGINEKYARKSEIESKVSSISQIENKAAAARAKIEELASEINRINANIESSKDIIEKISEIDVCPICLQEVDEVHKKEVSLKENEKIKALNYGLKKLSEKHSESLNELKSAESGLKSLKKYEIELSRISSEISFFVKNKSTIEKKQAELRELRDDLEELNKKLEELGSANIDELEKNLEIMLRQKEELLGFEIRSNSIKELKNRLDELDKERESLKKEAKDLEIKREAIAAEAGKLHDVEQRYKKIKDALKQAEEAEKNKEISRSYVKKDLEGINENVLEIQKEIKVKESIKQDIQKLTELTNWLEDKFSVFISTIEKHVMTAIYHEFNELFTEWFNMLMNETSMSARLDEDFTPIIEQNESEISYGHLSGGERTACALSYRLALNKVINDLITAIKTKDIIILDEPTEGFSSEQLEKMRDVLEQLNLRQVILVSHESKIEGAVNNIIRIAKEDGVSRIITEI